MDWKKLLDNAQRMREYHQELIACYKDYPEISEYHQEQTSYWQKKAEEFEALCKQTQTLNSQELK